MKGKKFTAAEKYFIEKENRYRKEIAQSKNDLDKTKTENQELKRQISDLTTDIAEKNDWIERLLTYTELDVDTLKKKIDNEQTIADITKTASKLISHMIPYGI